MKPAVDGTCLFQFEHERIRKIIPGVWQDSTSESPSANLEGSFIAFAAISWNSFPRALFVYPSPNREAVKSGGLAWQGVLS